MGGVPIRAPVTCDLSFGGGVLVDVHVMCEGRTVGGRGQVGAHVAFVVRGGRGGQVDFVCAFGVRMAHNRDT